VLAAGLLAVPSTARADGWVSPSGDWPTITGTVRLVAQVAGASRVDFGSTPADSPRYYQGVKIDNTWAAEQVATSGALTLESGEVGHSWVQARNIGQATWNQAIVHLGTSGPHDRASTFQSASWLSPTRPAQLDAASVGPGAVGQFSFDVKAPDVTSQQTFHEAFTPVADGYRWMDTSRWAPAVFDYTVLPPLPPAIESIGAPAAVTVGDPVPVSARVSDNEAVAAVSVGFDTPPQTAATSSDGQTWSATLPTAQRPAGPATVYVRAVDRAGHATQSSTPVTLSPPKAPAAGVPPFKLTAVVLSTRRAKVVRSFRLLGVRRGSRVSVACVRGCGAPRRLASTRSAQPAGGLVTLRVRPRRWRGGEVVEVRVERPPLVGRFGRYAFRAKLAGFVRVGGGQAP
jgi:hypothetical protein